MSVHVLNSSIIRAARGLFFFSSTILALVLATACNSDSTPSLESQHSEEMSWSMTYKTGCQAKVDTTACTGANGLKLSADGSYQVGPAPQGQVIHGVLATEDKKSLNDAVLTLNTSDHPSTEGTPHCFAAISQPTGTETASLTWELGGNSSEIFSVHDGKLCSKTLGPDKTAAFFQQLNELLVKYYPTPFPNTCLDAAKETEALYPEITSCVRDSDCSYVTTEFESIANDTVSTVYLDNCSVIHSLPAANIAALRTKKTELQASLDHTRQVCGFRIARDSCPGLKSFVSSADPAVCEQGVCRVNPKVESLLHQ